MRDSINDAIASTVHDMLEANLEVSFTKKELDKLGVKIVPVTISVEEIQNIRKTLRLSQSVFAKLLKRSWVKGREGFIFSNSIAIDCASNPPIIIGSLLLPSTSPIISA